MKVVIAGLGGLLWLASASSVQAGFYPTQFCVHVGIASCTGQIAYNAFVNTCQASGGSVIPAAVVHPGQPGSICKGPNLPNCKGKQK
jgi:hypothetical protein